LFNLDVHSLLAELVDALRFSDEKDVHLLSLRELVDVVTQMLIN